MARGRAKSMDQRSCWMVNEPGTLGKWRRPPTASPEPNRMIAFASFQGFIWAMSAQLSWNTLMAAPLAANRRYPNEAGRQNEDRQVAVAHDGRESEPAIVKGGGFAALDAAKSVGTAASYVV